MSAIDYLKELKKTQTGKYAQEWLDEAIKALEQEPCEDAVSRQAVINMVREKQHSREYCIEHHIDFSIDVGAFNVGIASLPPVKPRAKGEWIFEETGEGKQILKCSKCGTIRQKGENFTLEGFIILCEKCLTLDNFCPHCGAEMINAGSEK